jgi:response regulator of citrate/malate metabolism
VEPNLIILDLFMPQKDGIETMLESSARSRQAFPSS